MERYTAAGQASFLSDAERSLDDELAQAMRDLEKRTADEELGLPT